MVARRALVLVGGTLAELPATDTLLGSYSVVAKAADYTETTTNGDLVILATAALTVTLPTAVGSGAKFTVKKTFAAAGLVVLATTAAQTIDGGTTATLTNQYESITLVTDGTNWAII